MSWWKLIIALLRRYSLDTSLDLTAIYDLAKAGIHDWFNSVVHGEAFSPDLPFDELQAACQDAEEALL